MAIVTPSLKNPWSQWNALRLQFFIGDAKCSFAFRSSVGVVSDDTDRR